MTNTTPSLSSRVIDALADERDTDPLELPPLFTVVDPDALDKLFQREDIGGSVTFEYGRHQVQVTSEGEVSVHPIEHEKSPISEV